MIPFWRDFSRKMGEWREGILRKTSFLPLFWNTTVFQGWDSEGIPSKERLQQLNIQKWGRHTVASRLA
jgi:hypothetical protein